MKSFINNKRLVVRMFKGALSCLLAASVCVAAEPVKDALNRPSVMSEAAAHSFFIGADYAGKRIVMVGERGLILISDDDGKNWKQVESPVSVTLTAVQFANSDVGFAIGHGGTVLSTIDGGEHWQARLNGYDIAQSILKSAELSGDELAIASAKRLVADGPDKPLLDLAVLSPTEIIVVGAYGLAMKSTDGGVSWVSIMDAFDNDFGMHLYSICKKGRRILIAGEQGLVRLSIDNGQTFQTIETPYEGSYFTAELTEIEGIVLAGMRGNVLGSIDQGLTWKYLTVPVPASISASTYSPDLGVIIANQAGMIFGLGQRDYFKALSSKTLPLLNNILLTGDKGLIALSAVGPISVTLEAQQ